MDEDYENDYGEEEKDEIDVPSDNESPDMDEYEFNADAEDISDPQGLGDSYIADDGGFKDRDRVGMGDQGVLGTVMEGKMGKTQDMLNRLSRTPRDNFLRDVKIYSDFLGSKADGEGASKLSAKVDKIKYRNALAFLLGYRAIDRRKMKVDSDKIKEDLKFVKHLDNELKNSKIIKPEQYKIRDVDIYRYAKYILGLIQ